MLLSSSSWGCELKWRNSTHDGLSTRSSSSWGCELKCCWKNECDFDFGHPLREDVSWNTGVGRFDLNSTVILFVRMWVEMHTDKPYNNMEMVILFVRMWVEMVLWLYWLDTRTRHPLREDVSWNAPWGIHTHKCERRHPLREDVSWNISSVNHTFHGVVILFVRMWVEISLSCANNDIVPVILFVRMWVEI